MMMPIQARGMLHAGKTLALRPMGSIGVRWPLKASYATHTISTPTLADIEKRWPAMTTSEQADIAKQLEERQKVPWKELSVAEKRAAYYIAFGEYGPRAVLHPPGFHREVFTWVAVLIGVSYVLFEGTRYFAGPAPRTMTKEWQEATNERMKEQKVEPISGGSWVQSKK